MSTETAKVTPFAFDRRFDAGAGVAAERLARQHAADLDAARMAAYQEGVAAGRTQALAEIEAATQQAAEQAAQTMAQAFAVLDRVQAQVVVDAAHLARDIGEALAGWQLREQPTALIEQLAHEVFAAQALQPRLVVRVHDAQLDRLKVRLEAIAQGLGFHGRLIFLSDPDLTMGDCLIEWSDGGVECLGRQRRDDVEAALKRFIAGQRPTRDERA